MKITIEINMDDAAFDDGQHFELSRILSEMSEGYFRSNVYAYDTIYDLHGNVVGRAVVTE